VIQNNIKSRFLIGFSRYGTVGELNGLFDVFSVAILQIVRGGKVSRLQDLTVIRWKTFAVTTHYQKEIISLEKFRGY